MKQIILLTFILLQASTIAYAQMGIGTKTPKSTLQVVGNSSSTSTADGVQVPALSLQELDAKVSAYTAEQDGAIVYVNDVSTGSTTTETNAITAPGFYYYNSTSDTFEIVGTKKYTVGQFAQGGIIFWVDESGQHGLVCTKEDQSSGLRWYAGTYGNTQAKGLGPLAGKANTTIIISAQVAIGDDGNTYAARICNELQITEGGITYGDWYLPSLGELDLIYQNRTIISSTAVANGGNGFSDDYWSSNEFFDLTAFRRNFSVGFSSSAGKEFLYAVRAVRSF